MDLNPESEVAVYCECGAKYMLTGSHMDEAIECGNCGRVVRRKAGNTTRLGNPARTALQAFAEKHGDEEKIGQAAHFAKEHKYAEALNLYEAVLSSHLPLRDALYGMGYCHYRLGDAARALVLLDLAHRCGHTTALELIRKVSVSMEQFSRPMPQLPPLK